MHLGPDRCHPGIRTEQVFESLRDIPMPREKTRSMAPLVSTPVSIGSDHSDPELPKYPDAGSGAPIDRRLYQRNKDERGREESECAGRDPRADMYQL